MLKARVIPTLLLKEFGIVKGVGFNSWRRTGTLLPALRVYNSRDVDELVLLDITASLERRGPDIQIIADISDECSVPLTVGGGISHVGHIVELLKAGADKVAINTAAIENPGLVEAAARQFGSQCIVVSIDAKLHENGTYSVCSFSGSRNTGKDPGEWAREMAARGAGEILLTSIDRDGTMQGYDLQLVRQVTSQVDIPVIASGGAGNYAHMVEIVKAGGASSVAAASIFHFTEQTPGGAKQAMGQAGIPVRRAFVSL